MAVIGPETVKEKDSVQLTAVIVSRDWKAKGKLRLVELANQLLTEAHILGLPIDDVGEPLKAVIEGGKINIQRS